MASHVAKEKKLGVPRESREAFQLLEAAGILPPALSTRMQHMVGFRNLAAHQYQALDLDILHAIVQKHLGDFEDFSELLINGSG